MTGPLLNLDEAPEDAIERLLWLSGVKAKVDAELEAEFADAYFNARLERRFEPALGLGLHGKKKALALSRAGNERRGRMVRWGDGY
jgi:hypothetical protein